MSVMISRPLQIVIDDLGWFCPDDDRETGGASRSGASRRHDHRDYIAINELGRQLNMKVNCAFVVGEWDPDNRLKGIKCLSKYDGRWDNARYLDREETRLCAEAINASGFIDVGLHGLMHGYYTPGIDNTDLSDYYYEINGLLHRVNASEIRRRLDCFFDLLKYWGINRPVNSFVPPSGAYRWNELSDILSDYGIEYISTIFKDMCTEGEKPVSVGIERSGIINADRNHNLIPWDETGSDFSSLPTDITGIFGAHWPNFLHDDPERNMEIVENAVDYFKRCARTFGTVLSRDMRFCVTQLMFSKHGSLIEKNGIISIDVGNVPRHPLINDTFCISADVPLTAVSGCTIAEYENNGGFVTYAVKPAADTITLKTM
ncbi:MAG: hypothetical protein IKM02_00675 [Clostridia bacterium]|nr:hypothetical protein [Clostridia bacterium]